MTSTIIPTLRYHDAERMIAWLSEAFGFTRHLVVEDGAGGIAHAQLILGNSMIMLGSVRDDEFGALLSRDRQDGTADRVGAVTQSAYIIVEDVDGLCDKAKSAGAEIVMGPRDEDYGGRGFSCRDPEGQLWNFGSYDPWSST